MTNEEVSKLKRGDEVLVRAKFWGLADGRSYCGLLVEVGPEKQLIALDKRVCALPERRKFKCHDLVEYGGERHVLQEDENEFGNVLIEHPDLYIGAQELTLLLPADEVEKLTAWKGGAR